MTTHHKGLQQSHLKNIKNKTKTIEGRLNKDSIRSIEINDIIIFRSSEDNVTVKVINLFYYKSFEELIDNHLEKLIPNSSYEEALKIYKDIYPDDDKNSIFGIVGIEFIVLDS